MTDHTHDISTCRECLERFTRAWEAGNLKGRHDQLSEIMGKLEGMKRLRAPWIAMSDHSIPPSVSVEDFEWSLDLIRSNNRY